VGLLAGCASDGRELAQAQPWQTVTTRPAPPTTPQPQESSASGVTLSSPAFEAGGVLPDSATCRGDNRFPTLEWTSVPDDASELVVTLSDQTDPETPVLLWLMGGISPGLTRLEGGFLPEGGAFETLNDYGNPGFGSPCLNSFSTGRRSLQFRLHVLNSPSGITPGAPGNEAWATVRAKTSESASVLAYINN
jgi:phosphatidylethanolamine-binding protein (PEBP) family uncharacterized protein